MARDKVQTRLPADRAEEVYEFQEDRDISQAEAVRRLVYAGLEAVDEDEADEDDDAETEKKAIADGGYVTQSEFRSAMRLQNSSILFGAAYIGLVAGGFLGGRATVAGGVLVLAVLVASLVFVGGRDE